MIASLCIIGWSIVGQNAIEFPFFDPSSPLPIGRKSVRKDPDSNFTVYRSQSTNTPNTPAKDIERMNRLITGGIFSPHPGSPRIDNPNIGYRSMIERNSSSTRARLTRKREQLKKKAEDRKKQGNG